MACPNQSLFQLLDFLPNDPFSSWTKPHVRLIGTEEVLVQADSLNIDGAILANADVNEDGTLGEDKGNMSIDVNSLTITDQENKEESWSESFSFSSTAGGNLEQTVDKGYDLGAGTTRIGATNEGYKKENKAMGTLGRTTSLKVGGVEQDENSELLANVNRDVSKTMTDVEESRSGGLNVDVTVKNEDLAKAAKATGKAVALGTEVAYAAVVDLTTEQPIGMQMEVTRPDGTTTMVSSEAGYILATRGQGRVGDYSGAAKLIANSSAETSLYSRPIKIGEPFDDTAKHLFLYVDNSNYSDDNTPRIISLDGNMNGDAPEINTVDGFENDRLALKNGTATLEQIIDIPEGQTDPILDQETLWAIKTYVEARRVVAIEEGEIEAD